MANSSIMETLFQRSLDDLIKGIRLQSTESSIPTSNFLSKSMEEIRREIKSTDPHTKSTALLKLTYLHSLYGFDMSWAAFHVVEVMSFHQFSLKKIGYLAASLSFNDCTDVLLLATNQFRKDLSCGRDFEVSLALQCLSVVATTDLSRDLCNEIFVLLSSTRPYVKKRAIAVVLRVFEKYPDAVRVCFKRLVEGLESVDPESVSAAVGVFCELTLRDPKAYLPLAPEFYRVLIDCKNNWVLIKVLKIFAELAPLEPRLAKKIVEPVCEIMRKTMAKSLLFECIRTVVSSLSDYESAVKLAVAKVRELVVDDDPNLKYLGLQALSGLALRHLWAVLENKEVVIKSLSDADPNIKLEALRLVMTMVSEDNVAEITKVLVNYALKSDPEFCNEILRSILVTCSANYYEIVFDFDWYILLLGEMSRVLHCQCGEEIENQLIDIGMRVKDARPQLVHVSRDLLIDPALLGNPFLHRILCSAAWISGEYVEFSRNPFELVEALLQPRTNLLPPTIRAVYIESAFKVTLFCLHTYFESDSQSLHQNSERGASNLLGLDKSFDEGEDNIVSSIEMETFTRESVVNLLNLSEMALSPLSCSHEVEIRERTRNFLGVIGLVKHDLLSHSIQEKRDIKEKQFEVSEIIGLIYDSFSDELGPISANAQAKVPIPHGLTLKKDLSELDMIYGDVNLHPSTSFSLGSFHHKERETISIINGHSNEDSKQSNESTSLLVEHRKRHGLYYLPSEKNGVLSHEYPSAIETKSLDDRNDEVNDLVKLTEQSLLLKKKQNQRRPRPVVVKLDDFDTQIPLKKPEVKDDLISGAVRDVLLGNEAASSSSQHDLVNKPSSKRKGKEKLVIESTIDSRENLVDVENCECRKPSSRRSKNKTHGKEKRHNNHGKSDVGTEGNSRKHKQKSSDRHHRKHKDQQGSESHNVVQKPTVPDFLL